MDVINKDSTLHAEITAFAWAAAHDEIFADVFSILVTGAKLDLIQTEFKSFIQQKIEVRESGVLNQDYDHDTVRVLKQIESYSDSLLLTAQQFPKTEEGNASLFKWAATLGQQAADMEIKQRASAMSLPISSILWKDLPGDPDTFNPSH
jgi:hypothetical protein